MSLIIKPLFGQTIKIFFKDESSAKTSSAMRLAYQEGLRLQKIFNFFDPDSHLSKLNRRKELEGAPELIELIQKSLGYCALSEGAYDITHGQQFLRRKKGQDTKKPLCSYNDIDIDRETIYLNHPDIMVDLGSIAKGYIVDRMINTLKQNKIQECAIDARGDLFVTHPHLIDIQHPRMSHASIETIQVDNCGIATSGDYKQYNNNYAFSHLLGQKDIIASTVVAPSLQEADVLATLLCMCAPRLRTKIMSRHQNCRALTINRQLQSSYYNDFDSLIIKDAHRKPAKK